MGLSGAQICPTGVMPSPCAGSGADGRFSLSLEEGTVSLQARSLGLGPSFAPTTFSVTVTAAGVDIGDVVVAQYGTITGIVRDANGSPFAGTLVATCLSCSPVWTDASGHYTLTNIVPGTITVHAWTQGLPTPPWYPAAATLTVGSGQAVTQDVTLVRGAVVTGLITNPDGTPVPSGTPVVWQLTSPSFSQGNTVATDANGRYATPALAGGSVVITAGGTAVGARTVSAPVAIALEQTYAVDLQLGAGGWALGRVTGDGGAPVPGAAVIINGLPQVTTAADGTYRLAAAPPGSYTLTVRPPFGSSYGVVGRLVTLVAGQGTVTDVSLAAGGSITGTLTGPAGPVASAGISACAVPAMTPCGGGFTNAAGVFSIAGLGAGTYGITTTYIPNAQPPFGGASASPVVVTAGGVTTQNLQLGVNSSLGNAGGTVLPGGTISTQGEASVASPLAVAVRSPIQTSITITEGVPFSMANVTLLGQAIELHSAAPAPAAAPFVVTFTVDSSAFGGVDPLTTDLRRNGELVADCAADAGTTATPDPCVASRTLDAAGDLVVVARTTAFSVWAVTAPSSPPFDVSGFISPVRMGEVNAAKAGRTVPVKFALGGDQGLDVLAEGSPSSRAVGCTASATTVVAVQTAEQSALRYDADADQYTYLWRTSSSWTGCRVLTIRFVTGQELEAVFRFS